VRFGHECVASTQWTAISIHRVGQNHTYFWCIYGVFGRGKFVCTYGQIRCENTFWANPKQSIDGGTNDMSIRSVKEASQLEKETRRQDSSAAPQSVATSPWIASTHSTAQHSMHSNVSSRTGPLEKNTPSGFIFSTSDAGQVAGTTVMRQPKEARRRRMFFLMP